MQLLNINTTKPHPHMNVQVYAGIQLRGIKNNDDSTLFQQQ